MHVDSKTLRGLQNPMVVKYTGDVVFYKTGNEDMAFEAKHCLIKTHYYN